MYQYELKFQNSVVPLFTSQFSFQSEAECLSHFEKGLTKGIFTFKVTTISQIWIDLKLWGLIGRVHPVEVMRVLCAHGCRITRIDPEGETDTLSRSFIPVSFYIPIHSGEAEHIAHIFNQPISPDSQLLIPLFLELKDRLVIGSYYFTDSKSIDHQFPVFCKLLEHDMCLTPGLIQKTLAELFYEGYKIIGESNKSSVVIAEFDSFKDVIRGCAEEESLFYIGDAFKKAA